MQHATRRQPAGSRGSSDTLTILGILAFSIAGTATALVVAANLLMGLPALLAAAVTFSLIVFFLACGVALLTRKDDRGASCRTPVLTFRDFPARRPVRTRRASTVQHPERVAGQ